MSRVSQILRLGLCALLVTALSSCDRNDSQTNQGPESRNHPPLLLLTTPELSPLTQTLAEILNQKLTALDEPSVEIAVITYDRLLEQSRAGKLTGELLLSPSKSFAESLKDEAVNLAATFSSCVELGTIPLQLQIQNARPGEPETLPLSSESFHSLYTDAESGILQKERPLLIASHPTSSYSGLLTLHELMSTSPSLTSGRFNWWPKSPEAEKLALTLAPPSRKQIHAIGRSKRELPPGGGDSALTPNLCFSDSPTLSRENSRLLQRLKDETKFSPSALSLAPRSDQEHSFEAITKSYEEWLRSRPPAHLYILLDSSASMSGAALEASKAFIRNTLVRLSPEDTVHFFQSSAELSRPKTSTIRDFDFSSLDTLRPLGGSAFYSSLHEFSTLVAKGMKDTDGATYILAFTDGEDNLSEIPFDTLELALLNLFQQVPVASSIFVLNAPESDLAKAAEPLRKVGFLVRSVNARELESAMPLTDIFG